MEYLYLISIGLVAGILSGVLGIGDGVLIVPALMFLLGFSQRMATETSLAILLPPVGLAVVYEYYKHSNVDFKSAVVIAVMLFIGGMLGSRISYMLDERVLKIIFGVFLIVLGLYLIKGAKFPLE